MNSNTSNCLGESDGMGKRDTRQMSGMSLGAFPKSGQGGERLKLGTGYGLRVTGYGLRVTGYGLRRDKPLGRLPKSNLEASSYKRTQSV
jgi:hypothetical protein